MKKRIVFNVLTLLFVGFILQSCLVAKNYDRPEDVVDEEHFRSENITTDTLTLATLEWKSFFSDPLLINYIAEGLEKNNDIRIALENINAMEAYFKQGKWGYVPQLSADLNYSHSILSNNTVQGQLQGGGSSSEHPRFDNFQLGGNFSWELDVWGKIRSQKRANEATYLQSIAAHQAVRTQLISSIANTYYQLLALDRQKEITEETIRNREESVETMKALKISSQVTQVAVNQSQAQLYNAQALLLDLEKQIKITEDALSVLLGKSPQSMERGSLDDQEIVTDLTTGVPAQLLSNRPDVVAAEYGLINAFELTNVAKSQFFPTLRLTASGGIESTTFDNFFSASSLFANLIGGLTEPILNHRQIRTQHEVAQSQQRQAYYNYKQSILEASKEVSDALYEFYTASEKIEIKRKEYEAYQQATDDSEILLQQGMANYLDVLIARESALGARMDYINTKLAKLTSLTTIYRSLGGGVN